MSINLSNLKPARGSNKARKRIGRGGKHGTYSGRGVKGQKARSGVSGLKELGLKQVIQSTPKLRGFTSLKPKKEIVNIASLEAIFKDGDIVDGRALIKAKLVNTTKVGVKVLGEGKLTKKLTVYANAYSATAKKAIEDAGGKADLIIKAKGNKAQK